MLENEREKISQYLRNNGYSGNKIDQASDQKLLKMYDLVKEKKRIEKLRRDSIYNEEDEEIMFYSKDEIKAMYPDHSVPKNIFEDDFLGPKGQRR